MHILSPICQILPYLHQIYLTPPLGGAMFLRSRSFLRVFCVYADEPPPGDAIFCSCSSVGTLSMFGEGVISFSETPAPFGSGVLERGVPGTVLSF